ncbi:hypothetical protein [Gordonia sp. 852002-10350_SCH5691597]|uniref:hypothetical protein n=1 Tax=Gordonia sp. 852002-10350_SCH5691597 TaxID=1834085 RepID=UPI000AEF1B05|nr:hypothetical protein [Gordonia sp. 852002-10350_SCH5691597]
MKKHGVRSSGEFLTARSGKLFVFLLSVALATVVSVVAGIVGGGAQGDASPPPASNRIDFHTAVKGDDVVLTVGSGALRVAGDQIQIVDRNGKVAASAPLKYEVAQDIYKLGVELHSSVARLHVNRSSISRATPLAPHRAAETTVVVTSTPPTSATSDADARADKLDKAITRMGTELSLGMAIGTSVGTILGGVLGCLIGLTAGIVGCLPGLMSGATAGAVAGSVVIGGAAIVVSAIVFGMTMSEPRPKAEQSPRPTTQVPTAAPSSGATSSR